MLNVSLSTKKRSFLGLFQREHQQAYNLHPSRIMDSDAIDQFVSVTGSNPDTAKFFIESSNNDVAAAIEQYFSAGGQVQAEEPVPAASSQPAATGASAITPASTGPKPSAPAVAKPMSGQAKGDQPPLVLPHE